MRGWLVVLGVGVLTFLASAPAAAQLEGCETELPGLGVALLEGPAELADNPRARSSIIDELNPGTVIERRIRFSNGDPDSSLPLELAPVPASIAEGSFRVGDLGEANELTSWISISEDAVTVAPCDHVEVTVRVEVPADAEPGERYALIAAHHLPEGDGGNVTVASRVGIRAYLLVSGDGGGPPDLAVDTIRPGRDAAGNPTVTVGIRNPGGRALDVTGEIELSDGPGGLRAGPFPTSGATTLAPGDEGQVGITLDESLPNGPWRAEVTLRSGLLEVTSEAEITFPEAGEGEAVPLHPLQDRGVLLPIALGLLLLALLLLVIAWRRARDRDEEDGEGPAGTTGAPAADAPVASAGV